MPPERPLEQMGGFSPSTGDPLARWLSEWIPDASRTDNLRKLASSGAPERHLFVLVHGSRENAEALREEIAAVLTPLGLRLSPAKTRIVHMSETFDFLGFRIQCGACQTVWNIRQRECWLRCPPVTRWWAVAG
jgi:hypothetical protein